MLHLYLIMFEYKWVVIFILNIRYSILQTNSNIHVHGTKDILHSGSTLLLLRCERAVVMSIDH